ncbi:SusC/RagA family TonB-linked outer membrane protein [Niabella drilacis]|uniref:TonB-linked outer membrane protein, SusC/RagA family n=1 Tax=Niabella drilacis (strain DSM 25811 / CCM 8410 / CCUG 62505 / LMG 26954 / E90) TaxID=1285928 RepID=A0A1G7AUP3_NIADE|nr:SusC/RagA family TonB-linked outer membrane protein [Niabella drilacis]SDE18588.1 TonB-linked outer membrane protein, SusC/RagA family [Niabella drilacis]
MRKPTQLVLLWAVLLALLPLWTNAQNKTITGFVYDEGHNPLQGVTVTIDGTAKATSTAKDGSFTIAGEGAFTLIFTHVGYTTQTARAEGKTQLEVILLADKGSLDEVVVTTEFGMKRIGRAVGSSVQVIDGKTIAESGRDNFISALQGRVPGLNVTSTSGLPGASTTVVLRNLTSISGNNQPLYVVDGIPMNNSTFDPLKMGQTTELLSVRNMDYSSRGNDFNPEDIESISVLKGAAAAALYGSDASNGAIIITTKKGRAGKGRVTYDNAFRWDHAYGYPDMQTKYAEGAYGTTNYYYTSRYGGLYPSGTQLYDNVAAILQTGFSQRHSVSVEAGSEKATLRGSFSYLDGQGVVKNTDYGRMNLSLAGKADITSWLKFESSMQYAHSTNDKALLGTDGPLARAMLWPIVDNMANYLTPDGTHMRLPDYYTDLDMLNPLFAMNRNKNFDKSDRFITNVAFTAVPVKNTFLRAQVGWDVGMQTYVSSRHPYYSTNNAGTGTYSLVHSNFSDPTLNVLAGYNNKFFNDKFSFSGQVGYHQLENGVTMQSTIGSKFIIPDFQSINNTDPATVTSSQSNTKRRIQAFSGQFEFGYNNMAFITARGRNDWSSTLPLDNNRYFYPAIEGSLILSELRFLKGNKIVNFIKLRGSIARVGKDAPPLSIDPQLQPTYMTGGGFKYGFTGPNPKLKPEMTTAREIGFDTRLFDNRVNTYFSYFTTQNADQIVKGFRLSYATGFVLNTMNVGSFKTWGWEAHVDGDVIRNKAGLTWNVGINASHGGSKVVYLPDNVSEYYNPYTWSSGNIRNGIMVGNPITTVTGRAYMRNNKGQVLIDPTTGIPVTSDIWSVIGDREPKLRFGLVSSLTYKGFRLSGLFAGRYKATVINGTKRIMMTNGTSWESVDLRERGPVVFDGVLKNGKENSDNPTVNNIAVDYHLYGSGIFAGGDENWLEKNVNYLRLQELRMSYSLPQRLLAGSKFISNIDVYMVGNDLFTFTNYSGIDAVGNNVSAAAGGTGGEGIDVWSLPNPRAITVGLSISLR